MRLELLRIDARSLRGRPQWIYLRSLLVDVATSFPYRHIVWLEENQYPYHFEWSITESITYTIHPHVVRDLVYELVISDPDIEVLFKLRWAE